MFATTSFTIIFIYDITRKFITKKEIFKIRPTGIVISISIDEGHVCCLRDEKTNDTFKKITG